MILYIDLSERDELIIAIEKNGRFFLIKKRFRVFSRDILVLIKQLIKKSRGVLKDIKGIIVIKGPGSFTSLRIGIATANSLAFALNIPILGLIKPDKPIKKIISEYKKKLLGEKKGSVVLPFYGREPHITKPKRIRLKKL